MQEGRRELTVYYDGWCPLCQAIHHRLIRVDWLDRLQFVSMREPGVVDSLGVPAERLAARMHVRYNRTGHLVDGIDAVAAIAAQVPPLWPLWPVIRLSALTGLGGWLYDWVAARRVIIPVGACDEHGCPIHREP